MRTTSYILLIALALLCCPNRSAQAGDWGPVGIRGGFAVDKKDMGARQYEAFASYHLPWDLRNSAGFGMSSYVSVTGGILRSQDEYGFIGSLGPSFVIGATTFPLELDLGISVGLLSRDRFGTRDYNGIEQFISHGGLIYHVTRSFALSYRFQHMSNAGFNGKQNPGLNMHLFGLGWYFPD